MKNLQTFSEFVNESNESELNEGFAMNTGEPAIKYLESDEDIYSIVQKAADALGVDIKDVKQLDSESNAGTREFTAAEKAFDSRTNKLKIDIDGGISGPFLSLNKKTNVAEYTEQGFTAFWFTDKSKF